MRGLLRCLALLAAGGALAFLAPQDVGAHGDGRPPAGQPGDPHKAARTIGIVMSEAPAGMRYSPDRVEVREGEQVRFVVRNSGTLSHEFFIGGADENKRHAAIMAAMPDMQHDDPNAKTVAPGQSATLLWKFSHKGEFEFACLIPGHYEAGMHGVVIVK
jgi:uncharacterized cupredoxin-like copper-binding protein